MHECGWVAISGMGGLLFLSWYYEFCLGLDYYNIEQSILKKEFCVDIQTRIPDNYIYELPPCKDSGVANTLHWNQ